MKRFLFSFFALWIAAAAYAQDETAAQRFTLSGYIDTYYAYFTDSLGPDALQRYTTVAPRSRRFGLNIAQVTGDYSGDRLRGALTLHYGDIAEATWADPFRMIQEAHLGFRLGGGWWVDGGFFTTHIGTESFLPKNNWLSSTAVATYNEPFYQSGARLSYEGAGPWAVQLWVVSGYNFFLDANDAKSVGLSLSFAPADMFSITYTNLFGRESPDGTAPRQFRTYHNLYVNWQPTQRLAFKIGGDLGTQSNARVNDGNGLAWMYNALLTTRFQVAPQWAMTARGELFRDPHGYISGRLPQTGGGLQGLEVTGLTLGIEHRPEARAFLRAEARYLKTPDDLFIFWNGGPARERWEFILTAGLTLERAWNW